MKRLLVHLFIFLLPIIIIWGLLEVFYRTVPNNFSFKNECIREYYSEARVLIMGNSHAFYGINPDHFSQKTFNLSNISQGLKIDELLLNKHLDEFRKVKNLILTIDYFTLSQKDEASQTWRMYFYKEDMDLDFPEISSLDPKAYSLALAPRIDLTWNIVKTYIQKGTLVECGKNGWAIKEGVGPDNNELMAKGIASKHEDGLKDFTHNIQRLNRIIKKCKERDIRLILVTMPVTSYYAQNINNKKLTDIIKACNSLASANSCVQYVNLFKDARFSNSDFYDTDHLNRAGAKKCSEILDSYLQELSAPGF